jgi:pyruvate/2-oxoglutarate dehydrogenase complex dihydrolipoamide acyltransferase (E2) component
MSEQEEQFFNEPIPRARRFSLDAGYLGRRAHIIHGLLEIDVSEARAIIREHRESSGERLSFTAFIINCLGKAVESNPHTHAYRDWRNRLVIFKDVNINSMVEVEMNGRKVPMPHIFKAVNKRSFRDIHEEMRSTQKRPGKTTEANFMRWFLIFPAFIRRLFYRIVLRFPHSLRNYSSPITVTAVGMFGKGGSAWGIPMASFTLTITLGSIARKPGVVDDEIMIREYLNMTVSIDHDIVDGAPAARFAQELRQLIEGAYGLVEAVGADGG